ncbi:MAG: hypothetical protein GY928_36400 [Colwellia sp.]|nr:hypothetical protein [Colwellia sp.]
MSIDPSTYKTGNASPSNSAEDLSDNARVFDVFMNDKSGDSVLDRLGRPIPTLSKALQGIGWVSVGEWSTNPTITEPNQYVFYNNQRFAPTTLPYTVDSATNPDPNALVPSELRDVSDFQSEQEVSEQIKSTSYLTASSVADMISKFGVSDVGARVAVDSYYESSGSGLLFFKVVADSTGTVDGGKYIQGTGVQFEQNLTNPVRASQFGSVSDAWDQNPTDSYQMVQNAAFYCANNNVRTLNLDGNYHFTQTIKTSTGLFILGDGPMDGLNSLTRKGYGTAITSTANPVFHILNSDELPEWPQDTGGSANVGIKDLTVYSGSLIDSTAIKVGTSTNGLRNVTIDNIETRGYSVAIEIAKAYTLFMSRLSLRGLGRGVGTRGVLFSGGEVTSGYLDGMAVYDQEVAIECQSGTFAGFTIQNVDTDGCNHVAITSGYISNPALFRNIASEGTITSDFIFNHSSGVCGLDNFSTVVGTTTDHRVRCVGAGRTVIRNVNLNSSLVPSGKRQTSQEGTGTVEIYGSFDPRFGLNVQSAGKVFVNDALYSRPNPEAAANQGIAFSRTKNFSIKLGTTDQSRTLVLDITECSPMAAQVVHNVSSGGSNSIGLHLIQKNATGANFFAIEEAFATMTKISDDQIEMSFSSTHNNATLTVGVPDSITLYRKDIGA